MNTQLILQIRVLVIGLSAFLLFWVQPLIGKYVLTIFGGGAGVWAAVLCVFTFILFLGYLFIFLLDQKWEIKRQIKIYIYVVGTLLAVWLGYIFFKGFLPSAALLDINHSQPVWELVKIILLQVGIPFFILSTTSTALQNWFSKTLGKEQYFLYAVSNIGSLGGLMLFPFFLEPNFSLLVQKDFWLVGFVVYFVLMMYLTFSLLKTKVEHISQKENFVFSFKFIYWTLAAAAPAYILVAATVYITTYIAPIPLLWVLPLVIYLLTYILVFANRINYKLWALLNIPFALLLIYSINSGYELIGLRLILSLLSVGFIGFIFHGYLYKHRPSSENLPLFYLALSLGGAIGTMLASLATPFVFQNQTEFYWAIFIFTLVGISMVGLEYFKDNKYFNILEKAWLVVRVGLCYVLFIYVSPLITHDNDKSIVHQSRNFYGLLNIHQYKDEITMEHGNTTHGLQLRDKNKKFYPTSYYAPSSGAGRSVLYFNQLRKKGEDLRVGVVGLGAGTMAAYCRGNDKYSFYEIDLRMVQVSNRYFSYLSSCKNHIIKLGDARVVLERELLEKDKGDFHVLAIDAFVDDAIPAHLLTKEAVELYFKHLKDNGILAIHISNRYLDLEPVVKKIAFALDVFALTIDADPQEDYEYGSKWVLLTKDQNAFTHKAFQVDQDNEFVKDVPLWTDNHYSFWPIVSVPVFDIHEVLVSLLASINYDLKNYFGIEEESNPEEETN